MASSRAEIEARLLNNRRAGHVEHWRNKARTQYPHLSEEEIDAKATEMERDKLIAAGAKGSETYRRRAAEQRVFMEQRDIIITQLERTLTILRSLGGTE
jgi:hypothetical protein